MIGVAVKGLLGRKTRALLTGLAIILGVSMVSGTYVLTDTINKAFTGVLVSTYKNTSVVISGKEIVAGAAAGNATVSERLLERVRAQPDVGAAAGGIVNFNGTTDLVKLIGKNGKTIGGKGGAPTFGFGLDPRYPQFNPMKLVQGKWATGPGQVVVEKGTASKHGLHVGQRVGVSADGPTQNGKPAWRMRTYERGVEGETLACGTGAVTAACAIQEWGLGALPIDIQSRGGRTLTIRATKGPDGRYDDVWLAGEGRMVFRGVIT